MTLECRTGILGIHTATVVDDLNGGAAGIRKYNLYTVSTCIDSILNQLLDNRSRTVYHLTCCNLAGYLLRKNSYLTLHIKIRCFRSGYSKEV